MGMCRAFEGEDGEGRNSLKWLSEAFRADAAAAEQPATVSHSKHAATAGLKSVRQMQAWNGLESGIMMYLSWYLSCLSCIMPSWLSVMITISAALSLDSDQDICGLYPLDTDCEPHLHTSIEFISDQGRDTDLLNLQSEDMDWTFYEKLNC
jgi:hypothetical protein